MKDWQHNEQKEKQWSTILEYRITDTRTSPNKMITNQMNKCPYKQELSIKPEGTSTNKKITNQK